MDLASLKAALKPLSDFGQDEHTFSIPQANGQDLDITLRALLPKEEVACQRYASDVLAKAVADEGLEDGDGLTRAAALRYFDMYRAEVVAYALAQIGDVDFRKIKHIETGEMTEGDNPVPVKVPRHVAVRGIIEDTWSRGMITIGFSKYGDLVTNIAKKASKVAKESLADLDAEIEREEKYLADLKVEREARAKGDPSVTTDQIKNLIVAGEVLEQEIDHAINAGREDRRTALNLRGLEAEAAAEIAAEEAAQKANPVEPDFPDGIPEEPTAEEAPPPSPAPRKSVIPDRVPPPTNPAEPNPPQFRSSFEEFESPDSQAIEEDRVMAARRAATEAARNNLGASDLSSAEVVGKVTLGDGRQVDAVRLPAENISERTKKEAAVVTTIQGKTKLDPNPGDDQRNPNFKPPER